MRDNCRASPNEAFVLEETAHRIGDVSVVP